jgi:predicted nucleic acid-binding protein
MIAIDANAAIALLVDEAELGAASRRLYAEHDLVAPDLLPYEVSSVLRKLVHLGAVAERTARAALRDLGLVRLEAVPHGDIVLRMWSLRDSLSAYDAAYVAVAELFDVPLLTFDGRIRRSAGPTCQFVDI